MSMSTAKRRVKEAPGGSIEYLRGLARGLEDVRANLPVRREFRFTLDAFSFGYRSGFYLVLLEDLGEGRGAGLCAGEN